MDQPSGWVNVADQEFPDKDGILVCWDGEKDYTAFYYRVNWTVRLPRGTRHWYMVPEPKEQ